MDIGNDGLVVNGTTGEASTTRRRKSEALRAVISAVGDRAIVVTAGVGTNDTAHSVELAHQAQTAGAHLARGHALLQPASAVGDPASLPHSGRRHGPLMMLYDIPGRSVAEIATPTLIESWPNIPTSWPVGTPKRISRFCAGAGRHRPAVLLR